MGTASRIIKKYKDLEPAFVIRSNSDGQMIDGIYQPGTVEEIEITVSSQDLNGKEVMLLPEGDRTKNTKKIYILGEINTNYFPAKNDKIKLGSVVYKVTQIQSFLKRMGYYKVVGVEV